MAETIRVRIAGIIYRDGCDCLTGVKARPGAGPYRVKDTVNISKEAFERFRGLSQQNNLLMGGSHQNERRSNQDPERKRNLEALDLDLGAKPDEIKRAYREAIKKYHPDKFLNRPPEQVKAAEEKTKQLNTAYSILRRT